MENLVKVSDRINKIVSYVGAVCFVVLIFACVLQVFCRFILNHSLSWTEELARYAFIWIYLIGASLLIGNGGHATVTAILDLLHGGLRKSADLFIEAVILIDGVLMTYAGTYLSYASRTNLSTAMSVPMWCINSSVAVGGVLLIIQALVKMLVLWNDNK